MEFSFHEELAAFVATSGHLLNARCRGGASPFVFCGAGSGTSVEFPFGKGPKVIFV